MIWFVSVLLSPEGNSGLPLFTHVNLYLPFLTRACLPMFTHIYLRLPIFTPVYQCLLVFTSLPLFSYVFP